MTVTSMRTRKENTNTKATSKSFCLESFPTRWDMNASYRNNTQLGNKYTVKKKY